MFTLFPYGGEGDSFYMPKYRTIPDVLGQLATS